MRLLQLVAESVSIAAVGALGIALFDVFSDLHVFSSYALAWSPFVVPLIVGLALGGSRPNFRLNLGIALGVLVLGTITYFFVYSALHLPMISFSGAVYPPDPSRRFILHLIKNAVLLIGGVTVGGFLSGE